MRKYNIWGFIVMMLLAASCDQARLNPDNNIKTLPLTRSEASYVEANKDFATELLHMYYDKEGAAKGFVLSPVSLQMFFGMLNAAASEDQAAQINKMLGYDGRTAEGINSFCRKVLESSPTLDSKVTVDVSNQWWLNSAAGFKFYASFANTLKENYQVDGEVRDFSTEPMYEITRTWVLNHTHGMIDVGCPPPYPRQCIIANTAYFKADWKDPFDQKQSFQGDFRRENGSTTHVKYMNRLFRDLDLYQDNTMQALYLPLGDGAFQMEFYLPREGKQVRDVLSSLRAGQFPRKGEPGPAQVTLPSFDLLCSNGTLAGDLQNHFQVSLCDPDRSSNKYPLSGEDNEGVGIELGNVAHIARIIVNETGAEAAAVTINHAFTMNNEVRYFSATRPFVFVIREVGSGIVFFNGIFAGDTK
ncbi:MAG: hypothetical protein IJ654_01405 [Bacteroidales bacterium]|nr:hypothetical protein [Bacteroidales bacterium]